jgi:hypothetical protein
MIRNGIFAGLALPIFAGASFEAPAYTFKQDVVFELTP